MTASCCCRTRCTAPLPRTRTAGAAVITVGFLHFDFDTVMKTQNSECIKNLCLAFKQFTKHNPPTNLHFILFDIVSVSKDSSYKTPPPNIVYSRQYRCKIEELQITVRIVMRRRRRICPQNSTSGRWRKFSGKLDDGRCGRGHLTNITKVTKRLI